jgi:hypothetical protein
MYQVYPCWVAFNYDRHLKLEAYFHKVLFGIILHIKQLTMKSLSVSIICCVLVANIYAQDRMYLHNQRQPILVKVVEIGSTDIQYKRWPVIADELVYVIAISKLAKIVTDTGRVIEFDDTRYAYSELVEYENQPHHVIKFRITSPLFGLSSLFYEYSLSAKRSVELGASVIGLGIDVNNNQQRGFGGRAGIRFWQYAKPSGKPVRMPKLLAGGYIKPEVVFCSYSFMRTEEVIMARRVYERQIVKVNVQAFAALLNAGAQWHVDDNFVIDYTIGVGYGAHTLTLPDLLYSRREVRPRINHYLFFGGLNDWPIAFSSSLRVGYLF